MTCFTPYFAWFEQLLERSPSQSLPESYVIITPNRRLGRFVTSAYDAWQQQRGMQAWASLGVMAWEDWLEQLWSQVQAKAILPQASWPMLNAGQKAQCWLNIVQQHTEGYDLLQPDPMAQQAAQAWQYLQHWQLRLDQIPTELAETRLWLNWAERYEALLASSQWLDPAQLPGLIVDAIATSQLNLPSDVLLLGFDDWTPVQGQILQALRQAAVAIDITDLEQPPQANSLAMSSALDEIESAAQWAHELLEKRDSAIRIGIVIPDLPARRSEVERVFTRVFEPQYWCLDSPRHAPGFNLSVAQPLSQTPLIQAALDVLSLSPGELESAMLRRILHSPFIGRSGELGVRARIAADLQAHYARPKLSQWRRLTEQYRSAEADNSASSRPVSSSRPVNNLHDCLLNWQTHWRKIPKATQSYSAWSACFAEQLQLWHWPGDRPLDSLEYQQLAHWPQLLAQLAALDNVQAPVPHSQALSILKRLAYSPFAAQTRDSPVQVLGLLEAAGQHFDYLWVMQMESRHWPPAPAPNPLLPVAWQRELGMPRASAAKELQLAQRLTQRFAVSAPRVIFSYACQEGDQPLQPSPLISAFPALNRNGLLAEPALTYSAILQKSGEQEPWQDDSGPALNPSGLIPVAGGSQVLKDYAACQFRAFARHRLKARSTIPAKWGVSGLLRGNLLHSALDDLWRQLQTQEELLRLPDDQLQHLIEEAITKGWRQNDAELLHSLRLREIESRRMAMVIRTWLELDKQRPPFKVLLQESRSDLALGPLTLQMRYDRIDQVADGSLVVIDYKTSLNGVSAWLGERPDDPQVPLYCLSQPQVMAAAYGQLHLANIEYIGLKEEGRELLTLKSPAEYDDPDMPANWPALLSQWQQVLTALAEDFASGQASTNPKYGIRSCSFCDLQPLCRIHQRQAVLEGPAEDDSHE